MSRRRIGVALAALMAIGVAAAPAEAGSRHLNAYRVKASATNLEKLAMAGFDVTEGQDRYVVSVSHRGDFVYTFDQLAHHGVAIRLGD